MAEERGAVIGLLRREIGELEATLLDAQERRSAWMDEMAPAADPILEGRLDEVYAGCTYLCKIITHLSKLRST